MPRSLFSILPSSLRSAGRRHRRRSSSRTPTSIAVETVESRQLLSGTNDLGHLSDEFDDAASQASWQRVNEVENWNADQLHTYDIDQTQAGRMVMAPHTVVWYENWRGPMAFKEVTGDFVITTQVHITDRDDVGGSDDDDIPNDAQYSLGGVMIRTPRAINDPAVDWQPGSMADDGTNNGENYVFLSLGHGTNGQFTFEVKTTRNSNSQLELTPTAGNTATLQLARIGNSVIAMLREPGQDWVVHRRYTRADMPETMQVGIVSYTDWSKASDFDPFVHNSNVLTEGVDDPTPDESFNPDLMAGYDYARYSRPQLPAELEGVDLVNEATEQQLLSFLGANANLPADPPPELPGVNITAGSDLVSEAETTVLTVTRDGDDTSEPLEVAVTVSGEATNGVDFEAIGGTVTIPAGETSAELVLTGIDDDLVEGRESLTIELLDAAFYELGELDSATIELADNDFELVGDQVIAGVGNGLTLNLPATHPDGRPISYSASILGTAAYELDQAHDFWTMPSYYQDWGGQDERWIRGNGEGWFYLLPTGAVHEWAGSFEDSPLRGEVGTETYDDPTRLVDVAPLASADVDGNVITITPESGYFGSFEVDITKDSGDATEIERVAVTMTNTAPVIETINDQSVSHTADELRVPFAASDVDGDDIEVTVEVLQPLTWRLDQQYEFTTDGNYHDDWGGQNERWIRGVDNGEQWFYLLPVGGLYRWNDSFADSPLIADVGSDVYDDPTLLTNAEMVPATAIVDEGDIVITTSGDYVGGFVVQLSAADGRDSSTAEFAVSVTNEGPVLQSIGNIEISGESSSASVDVNATDADGDELTWTVEILHGQAWELDQEHDLQPATDFYTNYRGWNEKWLQNADDEWFLILPGGDFYKWNETLEASSLLATLDSEFYDDPNLIAEPEALPVTAEIVDGVLTVNVEAGFTGSFQIRVTVFDGFDADEQLVDVSAA